jgi:hypothetical protein
MVIFSLHVERAKFGPFGWAELFRSCGVIPTGILIVTQERLLRVEHLGHHKVRDDSPAEGPKGIRCVMEIRRGAAARGTHSLSDSVRCAELNVGQLAVVAVALNQLHLHYLAEAAAGRMYS